MPNPSRSPVAGYPSYEDYLRSPEWAQRRAGILKRDDYRCACGERATLVHHATYARIGREANADLVSLCTDCHRNIHSGGGELGKRTRKALANGARQERKNARRRPLITPFAMRAEALAHEAAKNARKAAR